MKKQKSFHETVSEIKQSINNNRNTLNDIVVEIFGRHDKHIIGTIQSTYTPVIHVDAENYSDFTLSSLSYDVQTKILWIDGSNDNASIELTNRSIGIEFYAGVVYYIIENENDLFSDDDDTIVDDDLPF